MRCVKKSEMKNQIRQKTISKLTTVIVSILLILGAFSGCGSSSTDNREDTAGTEEQTSESASESTPEAEENRTGLLFETAKDGRIDFTVLQEENPEIWGWLYIPGTDIDRPLLQSATSDRCV